MRSSNAMTRIGGPGSRMSGITSDMRSKSRILTAAASSLPPVGVLIDPTGTGGKKTQKERTVVFTKLVGEDSSSRMSQKSGKSSYTSSGRVTQVKGAMLRADDEAPLDFLDPKSMRNAGVGTDAAALAVADKKRRALASSRGGPSTSGFSLASDGRLIIHDDTEGLVVSKSTRHGDKNDDIDNDNDNDDDDLRDGTAKIRRAKARKSKSMINDGTDDIEGEDDDENNSRDRNARDRSVLSGGGGKRHFRRNEDEGVVINKQGWGMAKGKNSSKSGSSKSGNAERFSGSQFKGGKGAKGDVKSSSSKFEPFAYVDLGAVAAGKGGFSSVMASTTKSVRKNFKRGIVAEAEASRESNPVSGSKRDRSER
jgi:hypothetical protein